MTLNAPRITRSNARLILWSHLVTTNIHTLIDTGVVLGAAYLAHAYSCMAA